MLHRDDLHGHAVDGDILEGSEEIGEKSESGQGEQVLHRVGCQGHDHRGSDHTRLRQQDPWPPAPHHEVAPAVHDGTVDQLQAPGQQDDAHVRADLCRCQPLLCHVGWDGDGQQSVGQPLGRVQQGEGDIAEVQVLRQGRQAAGGGRRFGLAHEGIPAGWNSLINSSAVASMRSTVSAM